MIRCYIFNVVTKVKFPDNLDIPTIFSTLESVKCHANIYRFSKIAKPKVDCRLDQTNWQEVVK